MSPEDAGAAAGLVNVAHQLGGSFGLGVLVTVFASAGAAGLDARAELAHRIGISLLAGASMLALALAVVVTLIRPRNAGEPSPRTVGDTDLARALDEVFAEEIAV